MILHSFVENVLDSDISGAQQLSMFIEDTQFNLQKLLEYPVHKLNVVFCCIWEYLFKTYPTKQDFTDFLAMVNISHSNFPSTYFQNPNDVKKHIEIFLHTNPLFTMIVGARVNQAQFNMFIEQTLRNVQRLDFLTQILSSKLRHRYPCSKALPGTFGNVFEYFTFLQGNVRELVSNDVFGPLYPSDVKISTSMNPFESLQYNLYQRVKLLAMMGTRCVIAVEDDVQIDSNIQSCIRNMGKQSKMRPVVMCNKELPLIECYQIPFTEEIMYMLPKICAMFILVSNREDPAVDGVAYTDEKNIFWYKSGKKDEGAVSMRNYDRRWKDLHSSYTTHYTYQVMDMECFWKAHWMHHCPLRSNNHLHNDLLYYDFLASYYISKLGMLKALRNHVRRFSEKEKKNVVVLVDNRANEMSVMSCKFAMLNLPASQWECHVYTSRDNVKYYEALLSGIAIVHEHSLLNVSLFDIDVYNSIMEDVEFWQGLYDLGFDKCLVIQDDGMLIKPGIEKFLEYDYVGAPWADDISNKYIKENINSDLVGNGGLSLRTVSKMVQICEEYDREKYQLFYHNINRMPEDVYFVKYMNKVEGRVAPRAEAVEFACEQVLNPSAIGFHKVWSYHKPSDIYKYFQDVLESMKPKPPLEL